MRGKGGGQEGQATNVAAAKWRRLTILRLCLPRGYVPQAAWQNNEREKATCEWDFPQEEECNVP